MKRPLLFLALWGAVGLLTGYLVLSLLVGCICILGWAYFHIYKLNTWLWRERTMIPPVSTGAWGKIFDGIYKLQKSNRKRRKELGFLIKRFREGAETLPDAIVVFKADNSIVWCNKLAQQLLGLKWPMDGGQRVNNLIRNPEFVKYLFKADFAEPIVVPSPINDNVLLEFRIVSYVDDEKLLMARDVTKLKQLESMREDFVANVSHELRTPLTVLRGYLEMMEDLDSMPSSTLSKARDMMSEQTMRMRELVEQLLVLSKIESGSSDVFQHIVDVPALLEIVNTEALSLGSERGHKIEFHVDSELKVFGLDRELRSAFSNLVFNAVQYTPDNGLIQVFWQKHESGAQFIVKDNGDGIPQEHLSRLTERFYRVDKARSRKTGGSGLGLAIVKHVLSHHYSELFIESSMGQGSQFSFIIPHNLLPKTQQQLSA